MYTHTHTHTHRQTHALCLSLCLFFCLSLMPPSLCSLLIPPLPPPPPPLSCLFVYSFQINTIAAIRHSASAGHTVIMSQTDEIHESFYDLFNQRFRRIDDTKTGPRFYANIAIGAHHKPCRIHPSFQCLVVVKHSEVDKIPHPFLNRFEKYALTHKILLDAVLNTQPAYLKAVLQRAKEKVRNTKILMVNHSHSL